MIEINLLPGSRKKRGGKGGAAFKLPDFKALAASVKDPWLIACAVSWLIVVLVTTAFYLPRRSAVKSLEPKLEAAQLEADRMKAVLKTKRDAEAKRDTLLAQIKVIHDIDRQRYVWPHILDAVSKALPPYTWLDDITPRVGAAEGDESALGVSLQIHGKSADIQAITRFVRNLEESPFLQGATQVSTTVVTERGRDVFDYILTVSYQQPDSTTLTMQPLAASLVQGYRSGSARPPTRTGTVR